MKKLYLRPRIENWSRFLLHCSYPRDVVLIREVFRRRAKIEAPEDMCSDLADINAFLSPQDIGLLDWAARFWPVDGPIIELGSFTGASTIVFTSANRHVHAVDAWSWSVADVGAYKTSGRDPDEVYRQFVSNLRQFNVEGRVTTHRGLTHEIGRLWGQEGAILWIDAGHRYADVRGDVDIWSPHLHPDGLLIMHDVTSGKFPGVTRVASELLREGWQLVASSGFTVAFVRIDSPLASNKHLMGLVYR